MKDSAGFQLNPRLVMGVLIMLLGVVFLLDNMDVLESEEILRFWPVVLVLLGLSQVLKPSTGAARAVGLVLIVAGVWLLLSELEFVDWDFWDMWPVFLVLIGATLVWRALGGGPSTSADSAAARVSAFAFLNHIVRRSNSKDFKRADLTAFMGGCELDLREAAIGDAGAVVDCFAMWGGIDIRVPRDWSVTCTVVPVLGGTEDNSHLPSVDVSKRLLVKGMVIMGGVEVKN